MSDDRICVGAISGAFGVKGEVRLKSFCADPAAIADYGALSSEDEKQSFEVTLIKPISQGYAAKLSGVRSKEAADLLKGVRLFASRDNLPNLPDDEFYHVDLIGLAVFDTGGVQIGHVKAMHDHGAGDLMEVEGPGLKSSAMLPFTQACVPTVDLESGRVVVDPPDGALPFAD